MNTTTTFISSEYRIKEFLGKFIIQKKTKKNIGVFWKKYEVFWIDCDKNGACHRFKLPVVEYSSLEVAKEKARCFVDGAKYHEIELKNINTNSTIKL